MAVLISFKRNSCLNCFLDIIVVHFWAPTFKWGISIANIADFAKPPENISYPQQIGRKDLPLVSAVLFSRTSVSSWKFELLTFSFWVIDNLLIQLIFFLCNAAVTATGVIWSRYSTVITPVAVCGSCIFIFCHHYENALKQAKSDTNLPVYFRQVFVGVLSRVMSCSNSVQFHALLRCFEKLHQPWQCSDLGIWGG